MSPCCRWIYTAFCIKAALTELLRKAWCDVFNGDVSAAKPEHVNDILGGVSGKEVMKQIKQTIR